MKYCTLSLLVCCLFLFNITNAQYADTALVTKQKESFWKSKFVKKSTIPAILFTSTALVWPERENIREIRNRYIPTFRYYFDDYLQYAPAATVVALNVMGIKGKHKPARQVISYGFSMAFMGALVNGVKYTSSVQRPDATSKNSFPSGHTASAFMNAAFLQKEYGDYRHPLYSVGGYAVATATALGRGLNNRHWVTDVLAGAGIGLISTELGYLITEQLLDNKEMNAPLRNNPIPISNKPSFLEMHFGYVRATSKNLIPEAKNVNAKRGFNVGFEGAWFINKHLGFGAEYAFTSFPINLEQVMIDSKIQQIGTSAYTQALGVRYLNFGPYFSIPLANNWFITAKATAGISSGSTGNVILNLNDAYEAKLGVTELPFLKYKSVPSPNFSVGAGIQKRIGRNTALKAYGTYFNSVHNFNITGLEDVDHNGNFTYEHLRADKTRLNFTHVTFGLALTTFIW